MECCQGNNMWLIIAGTLTIGALLYKLLFSSKSDFWKKNGIPELDTSPALSTLDIILSRKSLSVKDDYAYEKMGPGEKLCGYMDMGQPLVLIKDLDLAKQILIKDFDHFVDRRPMFDSRDGILGKMLTVLEGDEWKGVRSAVSPTFTTGKIRRMMESFNSVGKEWVEEFTNQCKNNGGSVNIEVLHAINRYTTDVIANTAFGINTSTIKNPDNEFAKMAAQIVEMSFLQKMRFVILLNFPIIRNIFKLPLADSTGFDFMDRISTQGLKVRMTGAVKRNDFLQLLIEAKKGELKAVGKDELSNFEKESQLSEDWQNKKQYLTEENMRAQCIVFFAAGFSTTSNFITFVLLALALHPEIQEKLRKEVEKIVKPDGSLDYDDVGTLVYLDMVCCEVLRILPPFPRMERRCTKDYTIPELGVKIPKGTMVAIPMNAIHHSTEFYENPYKFDPENFSAEQKEQRSPYAFMPFGSGPRNCIGMRFALIESKTAIAHIVHNFVIEPAPNTPKELKGVPVGFSEVPPQNMELKITPVLKN